MQELISLAFIIWIAYTALGRHLTLDDGCMQDAVVMRHVTAKFLSDAKRIEVDARRSPRHPVHHLTLCNNVREPCQVEHFYNLAFHLKRQFGHRFGRSETTVSRNATVERWAQRPSRFEEPMNVERCDLHGPRLPIGC